MEYFKGTYSFFRYPNDRLVGFSPFLGYLNVKSGFLRKAFDMKREKPVTNIELLADEIFHSIEGNLTATISPRKPIYIIAKAGLLNEFIVHVMMNNIEGFKNNHKEYLIENHVQEYKELLECECNKKETEDECVGYCTWVDTVVRCQLKETTKEINNNKRKFTKNLREFFELINKCIENTVNPDENNIFTPYYLLGLTLMSYWYLIKNSIYQGSEKNYFDDYIQTVKMYIGNVSTNSSASNDQDVDKIDDYISKNNLIELPRSLLMIRATVDEKSYPACFETVINEFFNLLFYVDDVGVEVFTPEIEGFELLHSLVKHYEFINENNSDYTSHFIINKFVKLTTNIPGVEYNDGGYNIKSNYKNFLTILNYFLNTNYNNLKELLEKIGIIINDFSEENGEIELDIKGKKIILSIALGHSFSKRENINNNFKTLKDELFNIFYKFIYVNFEDEIDDRTTFINYYNMLNYHYFPLPIYEYIINTDSKDYTNNIIVNNLYIHTEKIPDLKLYNTIESLYIRNSMSQKNDIINYNSYPNKLKKIFLNGNDLNYIFVDKNIHLPESLEELHLDDNNLTSLSINFSSLVHLKFLNIRCNKLKSLPILSESLKILNIYNNNFKSLPNLPENLKYLNIGYNELESLIDENNQSIKFPKRLKKLYLNNNKLKSLPKGLSFPENLRVLNLSNNEIDLLINGLSLPKKLEELSLNNNKLISLPTDISFPDSLERLYLYKNKLKSLPEEINFPKKLKVLYLNNNKLKSLPKWFSFLENLEELFLNNNRFASIPNELFSLKKIKKIFIDKHLKLPNKVPKEINIIKI